MARSAQEIICITGVAIHVIARLALSS